MDQTNLHIYQNRAVSHIVDNYHCGLFLDMGLGKTVISLTAFEFLAYQDLDISNALVIGPKRVIESVWEEEAKKWEHLKKLKITKIIGGVKDRKEALKEKSDIYLISRDNIAWLCGVYGGSKLPFDMLIIDELSSFKNNKSVRFKALKMVQPSFKRVIGLTGTPSPNGLIDLWSQIYLLDRGKRLGKFISNYRKEYFSTSAYSPYKFNPLKDTESKVHDKVRDICISMQAKDYLDLPGNMINIISLTMPEDIKNSYKSFEKEKVLEIIEKEKEIKIEKIESLKKEEEPDLERIEYLENSGITISAANAAGLSNKLLQFANGAVYDEDKQYHLVHDLKIEAIKEIVEDANGKSVLIAWTYRHDLDRLKKALSKYSPRELKTNKDIEEWNSGKIRVLMMHPASGGHGLNLQSGGNIVVWFGQTWSLELYQQLNARLDRQGQKDKVIIHKIITKGTIDEDVVKAIDRKANTQDGLMKAVKAKIDKYLK